MGDFNCVLRREERVGSPVTMAEIRDFRNCVDTNGLHELKSSGSFYTWSSKQNGDDKVLSRIDRVLVNNEWKAEMPAAEVNFTSEGLFDHCPAILHWEDTRRPGRKHFKYFNMWSMASEFKTKVRTSWDPPISGREVKQIEKGINRVEQREICCNRDIGRRGCGEAQTIPDIDTKRSKKRLFI